MSDIIFHETHHVVQEVRGGAMCVICKACSCHFPKKLEAPCEEEP